MDYIDFKQKENTIIYQLLHSSDDLNKENSNMLFDYYKFLHFFRHNYLHYLVLKMLNQDWKEETQLKDLFQINMPEEFMKKTPDIVYELQNTIYFLDVSISVDIHTNNLNKRKKYEPIADWFLKNYKDTKFIHINVNHEYTNLQEELEKIKKEKIVINEFDYNSFYRVVDIINDKKDWVNQNIDKEIFNLLKQKEYNTPVVDDYSNLDARILFLNELKYENIGQYDDLDIDKKHF